MDTVGINEAERLQQLIARTIAVNPAGRNLLLIGGFRYRFLDGSARMSRDVDYHWDGDLATKQEELVRLFNRTLLAEVRRTLGYNGTAAPAHGPDEDSQVVRVVNLAFWKLDIAASRIEIPVEITKIAKLDPTVQSVKAGTIYPTASKKDMVESKIIALLNRTFIKHRDFVDLFFFQEELREDSRRRLKRKFGDVGLGDERVRGRVSDFVSHPDYHARAVQEIIDDQLDPVAAENINDVGGGRMVFDTVLKLLEHYVLGKEGGRCEGI